MAKTNPATNISVSLGKSDVAVQSWMEDQHRQHGVTHVGSFKDLNPDNEPYDVWYCPRDHMIFVK